MSNQIKGQTLIIIAAVCAITAAVHWPALSAKALSFDDNQYLIDNPLIQNPSWISAKQFLVEILEPSTVRGYYQPLAMISLMLDSMAGGRETNLRPFHITSLAFHTANTALVIVLLYMIFGNIWAAAATGLLFGVHPLTVEPIPWVGERKTLLAAFFALWSLIFYVRSARGGGWKARVGCFVMYLLALMSKPTSVPLPVVMLLMDYWPLKRIERLDFMLNKGGRKKTVMLIREKWPLFVLGVIFAIITYISQHRTGGTISPMKYGPLRIPLMLCHNIIFYLYKMVWPVKLSSHYAFPKPFDLSQPMVLAGVIGTFILIPLLLISLRWTRAALTGWLIFFVAIFPTMGVIGFTNVIASDKYAYLPAVGILMALTAFFIWVGRNKKIAMSLVAIVLFAAVAEAVATQRYLKYWQDTITLNKYMLKLTPDAPSLYNNLGFAYGRLGRHKEEIEAYREGTKFDSAPVELYYNLGCAYRSLGRIDEAIKSFKTAIRVRPDYVKSYGNLGAIYAAQNRWPEAMEIFKEATKIKPMDGDTQYNLGVAYSKQGRWSEAVEAFKQAVKLKPNDASAYFNLGVCLEQLGYQTEAIDSYEHAIKANPKHTGARFNLALIYLKKNEKIATIEQYEILCQLDPALAQKLRECIK